MAVGNRHRYLVVAILVSGPLSILLEGAIHSAGMVRRDHTGAGHTLYEIHCMVESQQAIQQILVVFRVIACLLQVQVAVCAVDCVWLVSSSRRLQRAAAIDIVIRVDTAAVVWCSSSAAEKWLWPYIRQLWTFQLVARHVSLVMAAAGCPCCAFWPCMSVWRRFWPEPIRADTLTDATTMLAVCLMVAGCPSFFLFSPLH